MSPSIAYFLWGGSFYYEWFAGLTQELLLTAYRDFMRMVAVLMNGSEGKHWLAKCPLFSPHVKQLASVFPNARFVHTHRDARERNPSACSLLYNFQSVYCEPVHKHVTRQVLFYNEQALAGIEQGRESINGSQCFDIDYSDGVSEPIKSVEKLYDALARFSHTASCYSFWLRTDEVRAAVSGQCVFHDSRLLA